MTTITVRRRATALATSRAVIICVLFVVVLSPILIGLLLERAAQRSDAWVTAYSIAAAAPALGILAAIISLIVVLVRRSRPVLRIGEQVSIPHSGVVFPLTQLHTVQLWSRQKTHIALLPDHVPERVTTDPQAVAAYSVALPRDATPRPFELVELIKNVRPEVRVDKLGTL